MQVESLQDWQNRASLSQDQLTVKSSSVSVSESAVSTGSTCQLIEQLEKMARYIDILNKFAFSLTCSL